MLATIFLGQTSPGLAAPGDILDVDKISATSGGLVAGPAAGDLFGYGVAVLGDVDGDGVEDVAVGAISADVGSSDEGEVYVLFMNSNGTVKAEQKINSLTGGFGGTIASGDDFGARVAGIGDVDLDGIPDLAVGVPDGGVGDDGSVWIVFLNANGTVKAETELSSGVGGFPVFANGSALSAVAGIGDLNGDSVPDIVVGDFFANVSATTDGSVWVLFLDTTGSVIGSQQIASGVGGFPDIFDDLDTFGSSVESLGDLDGDGLTDIAVGAYFQEGSSGDRTGAVYILFLNADGTVKSHQEITEGTGGLTGPLLLHDFFGFGIARVGDLDGDGLVDLAVGAGQDDVPGSNRGAVYILFLNANGTVKSEVILNSGTAALSTYLEDDDFFGLDVAAFGDLDGDGIADLLVGAGGDDDGASGAGAVYVISLDGSAAVCGDGALDPAEQCDDGNTTPLDGCSATCEVEYHDYQIDSFSVISVVPGWYVVGSSVPNSLVQLQVSLEAAHTPVDFEARFELVAWDGASAAPWVGGGPGDPSEVFVLGTELVAAGHVDTRPPSGAPLGPFTHSLALAGSVNADDLTESFEDWRAAHALLGNSFRFNVVIDPNDSILEFPAAGEANNTAEESVDFYMLPLTGNVFFGSVVADLVPGSSSLSGAGCAPAEVNLSAITYDWNPSPNDQWSHGVVTESPVVPACNGLADPGGGVGLDIVAAFNSTVPSVTSTMGGLAVEVVNTVLDPSGASPGLITVDLPPDVSYHDPEPTAPGKPHPSGRVQLVGLPPDQASLNDFANLTTTFAGGFLQAWAVPFSLSVSSLVFAQDLVSGDFGTVAYRYDYAFFPNDPRDPAGQNRLKTNDRRYSYAVGAASQTDTTFFLDAAGLHAQVDFQADSGYGHFPEVAMNWSAFSVDIDGTLLAADQTLPHSANTYQLEQLTACDGCEAGAPDPTISYLLTFAVGQGLASDGGVLGVFSGLSSEPAWGPAPNNQQLGVKTFQRNGDVGRSGVLYLPGFLAQGTGPGDTASVPRYLLGMRAALDVGGVPMPDTHHSLQTTGEARRGNHFMAGVNMGPEIYSTGPNNQPVFTSFGETLAEDLPGGLAQTETVIQLPGAPNTAVIASAGTKYVLRRGGVTGVFNTDSVPDPTIYGYDFDFSRFAFRLATNVLDDFTWLDGTVSVDEPGLFDIAFTSLELECTGDIGAGHVVKSDCVGDPQAPNCAETLHAWTSDFDVLTMTFEPDPPPGDQCLADNRIMEVGSIVYPAALVEPLGMVAQWNPDGTPGTADFTGKSDREMDRPESPLSGDENVGFDIALDSGVALLHSDDDNGWWEVTGTMGLPFWESLSVKARLENDTLTTRRDSVVVDSSAALPLDVHSAAVAAMNAGGPGVDLSSEYIWGATGWSIGPDVLPIRYETGRNLPNGQGLMPRFGGIQNRHDIVVLQIDAGTDFVTPEKTKVSFGASANFSLDVDIHIDVADPDSVAEIDAFLDTFGLGTPISDLLYDDSGFMGSIDVMNEIVGPGLSKVMKLAVEGVLPETLPVIEDTAGSLEVLRGLPAQAAAGIANELDAVIDELPAPLTTELSDVMDDVYNDLPPLMIASASGPLSLSQINALDDIHSDIGNILIVGLSTYGTAIGKAKTEAANLSGNFASVLATSSTIVSNAQSDLQALVSFLDATTLAQTGSGNPVVDTIQDMRTAISDVRAAVGFIDLQQFSGLISSVSDVNIDGVAGAQRDILEILEDIDARLTEADQAISGVLGAPSGMLNALTAPGTGELDLLITELGGNVLTELQNLEQSGALDTALANVTSELATVEGYVNDAVAFLILLQDQVQKARDGETFPYDGFATAGDIQQELNDQFFAETGFSFNSGITFVQRLNDQGLDATSLAVGNMVMMVDSALAPADAASEMSSPRELRKMLVRTILNSSAVEEVNNIANMHLNEIGFDMNNASLAMLDQFNFLLSGLFEELEGVVNDALAAATESIPSWGFTGAGLDGFALIAGDELERMHVEASFSQDGDTDESDIAYGAALDVTSWTANGKGDACGVTNPGSRIDAIISIMNIPIEIGAADILLKKLYVGFTLEGSYPANPPVPVAFFGGIVTEGEIDFQTFKIFDVQLHVGVGDQMGYAAAKAGASFDGIQMQVAFMIGKTCDITILEQLDPQAAEFIGLQTAFNGAFVRGGASIPIYNVGCLLTIGASADAGMWVLAGPPLIVGGIVGGGVYGEGACIVAIKGMITTFMQSNGGEFEFQGEGFVVGGFGFDCNPESWVDVPASRNDDWCATGDASFKATYKGSWNVGAPEFSALH